MPTDEKSDTLQTTTSIPHFSPNKSSTICASSYGSNHWITYEPRIRCNSYHCRSWMLMSGFIPSLPHNNHRSSNCPKISATLVPLVWITRQNNFGSRSPVHITLWQSIDTRAGHSAEYFHGIPSSDRWSHGAHKSMGRAISASHTSQPERLEYLVTCGNSGTQ